MQILRPYTQVRLEYWPRRAHYEALKKRDYPYIGVTTELDITPLLPACKHYGTKFSTAFLYIAIQALNNIENFRYRIFEDQVVLCDLVDPSFNVFIPEDEMFYFAETAYNPNYLVFSTSVEQAKKVALAAKAPSQGSNRVDVVYFSSIPWFRLSDIMQPMGMAANDSVPRVIWGKYESVDGKTTIPFSITGHHGLFDGVHIAQLLTRMGELIEKPRFLEKLSAIREKRNRYTDTL